MSNREMLDRWSMMFKDRITILNFWEWLESREDFADLNDVRIQDALDEYHEINQRQLDDERRELLVKK